MKTIMMSMIIICVFPFHNSAQVRTTDTARRTRDFIKSPALQPANLQRPANYNTSDMLNNSSYQNNKPVGQPIPPNNGTYQGNGVYHDRTKDNAKPPANSTQNNGLYNH